MSLVSDFRDLYDERPFSGTGRLGLEKFTSVYQPQSQFINQKVIAVKSAHFKALRD
jgi:hypothetical protein